MRFSVYRNFHITFEGGGGRRNLHFHYDIMGTPLAQFINVWYDDRETSHVVAGYSDFNSIDDTTRRTVDRIALEFRHEAGLVSAFG